MESTKAARQNRVITVNEIWMPYRLAAMASLPGYKLAKLVMIATKKVVPIEPATWRRVLLMAVPCAIRLLLRVFRPQVVIGIMAMEMPTIRIV